MNGLLNEANHSSAHTYQYGAILLLSDSECTHSAANYRPDLWGKFKMYFISNDIQILHNITALYM